VTAPGHLDIRDGEADMDRLVSRANEDGRQRRRRCGRAADADRLAAPCPLRPHPDEVQQGRLPRVRRSASSPPCDPSPALYAEVVGPDAQEIAPLQGGRRPEGRGRDLDMAPGRQARSCARSVNHSPRRPGHHRAMTQTTAPVACWARARASSWSVSTSGKRGPSGGPNAERRVFLGVRVEERQRLVGPGVQGPDHDLRPAIAPRTPVYSATCSPTGEHPAVR